MSNPALNWAFQQRTGSSSAKLVLVTLADLADSKSNRAFPSVAEICFRTELNRKTVLTAMASLEKSGLISDTGERVGRTKLIPIYTLPIPPETNGPENGSVSSETVPFLRGNGPVFTPNGPKNGLRTPSNPSLTKGEAPPIKKHPRFEREIRANIATCEAEIEKLKMKHSRWDSMNGRKWDKGDYENEYVQWQRALKRSKEELLACLSQ